MPSTLEIATLFYAAVARGDAETAATYVDPERLVIEEAADLPFGGAYRGLAGFRALFVRMGEIWKRAAIVDLRIVADDETAVARLALDVIARRTGLRSRLPLVELCRLQNGRITHIQPYYFDAAKVWAAAGLDQRAAAARHGVGGAVS